MLLILSIYFSTISSSSLHSASSTSDKCFRVLPLFKEIFTYIPISREIFITASVVVSAK